MPPTSRGDALIENQASDLRALLVDDDPLSLSVTGTALRQAGFSVIFAKTAANALEFFGQHDFHVGVVDLHLEDASGVDLIRWLRQARNGTRLRIMAWTASDDHVLHQAALQAGADDVYQKHLDAGVLAAKFDRLAQECRADADTLARFQSMEGELQEVKDKLSLALQGIDAIQATLGRMEPMFTQWQDRQGAKRFWSRWSWSVRRIGLSVAAVLGAIGSFIASLPADVFKR